MKKLITLFAATAAVLLLFGCDAGGQPDLNASKITPSQSVLQKYPGLKGEYYADGSDADEAAAKLINKVIPDILKQEITKENNEQVDTLEVTAYDISSYDEGDVATLTINAVLNGGEPMSRTVLAFIKSEKTDNGCRSYFLSYHNMDQTDTADDEAKLQMLHKSLEQAEIGVTTEEETEAESEVTTEAKVETKTETKDETETKSDTKTKA
ncbi:MAG: hypothetical protein ACI4RP_01685 [Acutalibacteraceae bacterium]